MSGLRARSDLLIGVGLAVLVMVSRLPFPGRILYHWDSINFALSLQRFDVAASQPHVPGYILYVGLARLVNAVVHDAQRTLVGISVIGSGLACALLYALGRVMFDRAAGLIAAVFLASSPLFWFYGEVALPHTLDCAAVIAVVWLLYQISQGREALALPAAVGLGIAGGLRPQSQIFLAPLALFAARRLGWRRGMAALGVLILVDLAWFVPLAWLSGGVSRYLQLSRAFASTFTTTTSVFSEGGLWGLARNLRKLSMYTLYGWSVAAAPAVLAGINARRAARSGTSALLQDARLRCLLLWLCPSVAFYSFIHMGQQGLVFVFLPALCLVSAVGARAGLGVRPRRWRLLIAALVAGNAALFLAAPTYPLGGDRPKLLTVDTLRQHDAYYLPRFAAVRHHFSATHAIVLSSQWRYPQYYLPEYRFLSYEIAARWEQGEGLPTTHYEVWVDPTEMGVHPDSGGFVSVILFDDQLAGFNQSMARQEWLALPAGERLPYMRVAPQERLYLGPRSFAVVPATGVHPGDAQ